MRGQVFDDENPALAKLRAGDQAALGAHPKFFGVEMQEQRRLLQRERFHISSTAGTLLMTGSYVGLMTGTGNGTA